VVDGSNVTDRQTYM